MDVWGLLSARGAGPLAAQVTGKLEVIGAEGGIIKESRLSVKRLNPADKADAFKVSADCLKGKLQVLGPNGQEVWEVDMCPQKRKSTPPQSKSHCVQQEPIQTYENTSSIKKTSSSQTVIDNHNSKKEKEGSMDDDDSDTDDSGDDHDEKVRAPLELMAEFLKALMDRDYVLSSKLVEMNENERNAATEDEETDEDSSESEDSTDDSDSDSDDNSTEAYCSSSGAEDGI